MNYTADRSGEQCRRGPEVAIVVWLQLSGTCQLLRIFNEALVWITETLSFSRSLHGWALPVAKYRSLVAVSTAGEPQTLAPLQPLGAV